MSDATSAIDEIFEISKKIKELTEIVGVLEKNIKSLNNKFVILTKKIDASERSSPNSAHSFAKTKDSVKKNNSSKEAKNYDTNSKLVLGGIKTYGYIADDSLKPLPGVSIDMLDSKGDKIRSLSSNRDGYWEAMLPSGSYTVVYNHSNFEEIKKEIFLKKGIGSFRVG